MHVVKSFFQYLNDETDYIQPTAYMRALSTFQFGEIFVDTITQEERVLTWSAPVASELLHENTYVT